MNHKLSQSALTAAISWLETRIDDPDDEGEDADAPQWLAALEAGNGTADLPLLAWEIIADDILRTADEDMPIDYLHDNDKVAQRRFKRYVAELQREADAILATIKAIKPDYQFFPK